MKILVEGKLPVLGPEMFRGICTNCKCHLEVTSSEAHHGFGRGRDNLYVKCPTQKCEFEILVEPYIVR